MSTRHDTDDEQHRSRPSIDPAQLEKSGRDVGGPSTAIGSEAESALVGDDAESSAEGRTGSNPDPTGV